MGFKRLKLSAPGKIILCGEHAVVYGKKALACAINQRTHLDAVRQSSPNELVIELNDINQTLRVDNECFKVLRSSLPRDETPTNDALIESLLANNPTDSKQLLAVKLFLMLLADESAWNELRHFKVSVNSDLPISSGLGSSASFSVCLAAFMLLITGKVKVLNHKSTLFSTDQLDLINQYTFLAEKIFHGNPSGIDNTVTTFGQYILFEKGQIVNKFSSGLDLPVLVVNSCIPKQTKEQVAKVRELYNRHTSIMEPLISTIGCLVDEFARTLDKPKSDEVYDRLNELVRINQGLLYSLQISNSSLNEIVNISADCGGFSCKITGAGGGGCCFVLLSGSKLGDLDGLVRRLDEKNYETFKTQLGCNGILIEEIENFNS